LLLHIKNLLNPTQLAEIDRLYASAPFVDGAVSAGPAAAAVKNNETIDRDNFSEIGGLDRIVGQALINHPMFRMAVLPARILSPQYARYRPGMAYGQHADNPLIQLGGNFVRTDVSVTVFLNPPDDYKGGELVMHSDMGTRRLKHAKGDAVLYSTNVIHEVAEVTSGERRVAVTWAQSMIANESQRQTLYDLDRTIQGLRRKKDLEGSVEIRQLIQTYGNLFRMWAVF